MSKAALAVKISAPEAIKLAEVTATHGPYEPGGEVYTIKRNEWQFTNPGGEVISNHNFDSAAQLYAEAFGLDGEAIDSIVKEHCAIVCVPMFPGFYHSGLDADLDNEESQWADYEAEKIEPDSQYHKLAEHELGPELAEIRKLIPDYTLDSEAFAQAAFESTDYSAVHMEASQYWIENLVSVLSSELDYTLDATWESMTSPRFYNFETDRVFCFIPWTQLEAMKAELQGKPQLAERIKRRFTSRSGFSSFYSNELQEWEAKPLREWDHNETGTLLDSFIRHKCEESGADFDDIESAVNTLDSGNGESSACIDAGRDYDKLFNKLRDTIAEAMAEHLAEHPEIEAAAQSRKALADLRHGTPDMFETENK